MLCVAGFSILVKGSFICLFSLHLFPCPDAPYVPKNQTKQSANRPKYFSSNKMMGVAKKHRLRVVANVVPVIKETISKVKSAPDGQRKTPSYG